MTYPPQEVLLGGGVKDFRYLQVGVNTEAVLRGSGGCGSSRGAVLFVSRRSRLHMRVFCRLQAEEETNTLVNLLLQKQRKLLQISVYSFFLIQNCD